MKDSKHNQFPFNPSNNLALPMQPPLKKGSTGNNNILQLSPIRINEDYRKEWNITQNDYACLTLNGELLRPTLYRIGGLNNTKPGVDKYFMLIKYVEAYYSKEILRISKSNGPKHLESRWCIIDECGNEKKEFKFPDTPYLMSNSCIYSIDRRYYNIETGEYYGYTSGSMSSDEFLFLDNKFEKEKSKCGVMKINKKDGTWELFN